MTMNQRDNLRQLIREFCNERECRTFRLSELNRKFGDYREIGIGGNTPQATVRRLLQELRDENTIQFRNHNGNYTFCEPELLQVELQALAVDITANGSIGWTTDVNEHLIETHSRDTSLVRQAKEQFGTKCFVYDCRNQFVKNDNTPYIEVHHTVPLHQGGEDTLRNMSVVCAHHHRMAHFAAERTKINLKDHLIQATKVRLNRSGFAPK